MDLQVNGWWKANARMRPYCENVRILLGQILQWSLQWVNRQEQTPLSSTSQADIQTGIELWRSPSCIVLQVWPAMCVSRQLSFQLGAH